MRILSRRFGAWGIGLIDIILSKYVGEVTRKLASRFILFCDSICVINVGCDVALKTLIIRNARC